MTDVHEEKNLPVPFRSEAIHSFFGLSYANYLVLHRSKLQSVPDEWQNRFVACMHELERELGHYEDPPGGYDIRCLAREPQRITERWDCDECNSTGYDNFDRECAYCHGQGEVEGEERWETAEDVGIVADPVPQYWRGRTRLRRASNSEAREIRPAFMSEV